MKISAAAILILCVVIDQKATVQGGLLDRFRGKDKALDEASGGASGGFSGGLSGNLKLPGNILSECSVGGNVNGNIGASTSGGIQGGVNAEVNLPSCDCIRRFDTQGSVGGGGSAGFGGFGVSGGASFGGSLAMPGVNCVETDNPPEEKPDEEQDPSEEQESSEDEDSPEEESSEEEGEEEEVEVDVTTLPLCTDLRQQDLQGSLGGIDRSNKVAPGNRNKDNVFEKISVIIPGVNCYDPEPPKEESEESTEAPEETEGSEESTEAPEESEESEESTEAPEESEESEESTEAPEESEESEESTEAPEESEESTEAPKESEESIEAPKESEESEESTEAPEESEESEESTEAPEESEESEESTEAPEESEESEESTEAPEESKESEESTEASEEAPGTNSYCYRIDIIRDAIISPQNNLLTVKISANEDAPAEFYQTMDMGNALKFFSATISLDEKLIYDSKPEKKMTNVCNDSYPEGSIEANIWKIINLEVMFGEGCPVEKGNDYKFPKWLNRTELTFNEPLDYGNYNMLVDFDTSEGTWALKLEFDFVVDENSECTAGESFDVYTEASEEFQESEEESEQCYIVDMDVQVVKIPIFMEVLNKPMNKDNAFKINGADIRVDDNFIYDSKPEEMTNACEDSYPEGSFQANIWHMFNSAILKGKGCPVEQGSIDTFPKKLDDMQLKMNKRLEPGDYTAHLDLAAPDGTWAGGIYFYFKLDSPSECREEEEEPQEPMGPVEDESNSNCYNVDIKRKTLLVPENKFLKAPQIDGDVTAKFYQTMDMDNALQFDQAEIYVNKKSIYDLKHERKMKNACDDSYPEGSFEANIWKMFNLCIMNGQKCPIEEGDHTFLWWLRGTELNFNDPLEYGNYTVRINFDTPQGDWALGLYFDFVIDENSMCTRS